MIRSANQSMLNALVGLSRLESQVARTLRNVNDPHALAMGDDFHIRLQIKRTAEQVAELQDDSGLDIEV